LSFTLKHIFNKINNFFNHADIVIGPTEQP